MQLHVTTTYLTCMNSYYKLSCCCELLLKNRCSCFSILIRCCSYGQSMLEGIQASLECSSLPRAISTPYVFEQPVESIFCIYRSFYFGTGNCPSLVIFSCKNATVFIRSTELNHFDFNLKINTRWIMGANVTLPWRLKPSQTA